VKEQTFLGQLPQQEHLVSVACVSSSIHTSEDMAWNSKRQKLNRDDIIELILDPDSDGDISDSDQSDSDVYDNDLHEDEEQPDTSNQRVYRQGRTVKQADRGDHDYNTDEVSDSDETVLPHRTSGTMAWRHQADATNTRIY
jgi:hypothetical protein